MWTSPVVNTEIRLIIFLVAENGEALYSQQKQVWELTVAQIINFLLQNSDLNDHKVIQVWPKSNQWLYSGIDK